MLRIFTLTLLATLEIVVDNIERDLRQFRNCRSQIALPYETVQNFPLFPKGWVNLKDVAVIVDVFVVYFVVVSVAVIVDVIVDIHRVVIFQH